MRQRIFSWKLQADDWFLVFLLLLPTVMALIPVILYAPPGLAIRSTPYVPLLFQAAFIVYAAWSGGFSWSRLSGANRPVLPVSSALFWSGSRGGVVALLLGVPLTAVLIPGLRTALFPEAKAKLVGTAISSFIPVPNQKFGFSKYWMRGLRKARAGDVPERTPAFLLVNVMLIYAKVDGVYFYYHALIPWAFCIAIVAANVKRDSGYVARQ